MFQAFKTFFWETEIRGNGEKKTEVTLYIFTRPIFHFCYFVTKKEKKKSRLILAVDRNESRARCCKALYTCNLCLEW